MTTTDPEQHDAAALLRAGRYEEAACLLGQLFDEAESEPAPSRTRYFMTMFEWRLLLEDYPPARVPLSARRDAQVARLLAGADGTAAPRRAGETPNTTIAERRAFRSSMR